MRAQDTKLLANRKAARLQGRARRPVRRKISALLAQDATEYLVLLAVVLIVALVGIALLGFFPGMAAESKARESELYWQSATPIAIAEWGARYVPDCAGRDYTHPYFRVRNTGTYPITITKMLSGGNSISKVERGVWGNTLPMRELYSMQPGEEKAFVMPLYWGLPDPGVSKRQYVIFLGEGSQSHGTDAFPYGSAQSLCPSSGNAGYFTAKDFGFEYETMVEGQTITKQQVGKPVVIKCIEAASSCH